MHLPLLVVDFWNDYLPFLVIPLNWAAAIAAAFIISKKGFGRGYAYVYLLFGLFCCGPLALFGALINKNIAKEHEREDEQRRQQIAHEQRIRTQQQLGMRPGEPVRQTLDNSPVEPPGPVLMSSEDAPEPESREPGREPGNVSDDEVWTVSCRVCRKALDGAKSEIQALPACPFCGARPFDFKRQLPS